MHLKVSVILEMAHEEDPSNNEYLDASVRGGVL